MPQYTLSAKCELQAGVRMVRMGQLFAQNDKLAHSISVTVTDGGAAADLSGLSANGYFIRPDDATVTIPGTISGNTVTVALPNACYEIPGHFSLIVKVYDTDHAIPVFWGDGTITRSSTDSIVDPAHVVPDLAALLAQIEVMEEATAEAEAAAARTENMTVSASAASGSTPTATVTTVDDHYNIAFGLVKGEKGDTGNTGNGISEASTSVSYQASGSGTVVPSGTWLPSPPTLTDGQYLWTRVILTYTSGNTQTFYSVGYRGADGTGADPFTGATASTAGSSGWVPAPLAGDQGKYLKGDGGWSDVEALPAVTSSDNGKLLRVSNGAWGVSFVPVFAVGASGLVPAPSSGDQDKYLKGDGSWGEISGGSVATLWQNASPTSNFAAQTITLSDAAANYNLVVLYSKFSTDSNAVLVSILLQYDSVNAGFTTLVCTSGNYGGNRDGSFVTSNDGSQIQFGDGAFNKSTRNDILIPYKILGIKL